MKTKDVAIPIRCVDFSNTSQIVTLFSREHGLVEGIAKGAHRLKSPFQGPFDLCVLYEIMYLHRAESHLAILTESVALEGFRGLRLALERHLAACHVIELLRAVGVAGEPEPPLFDLALRTLGGISSADTRLLGLLLLRFDAASLRLLGLLAPMDSCIECGRVRPRDRRPVFISPLHKGILCRECRAQLPGSRGQTIPGPALEALEDWIVTERMSVDVEALAEPLRRYELPLRRMVSDLRTNVLERDFRLLKSSARWFSGGRKPGKPAVGAAVTRPLDGT